jgi:signal transduction histidine kinase/CheY-like chemotaxis protein
VGAACRAEVERLVAVATAAIRHRMRAGRAGGEDSRFRAVIDGPMGMATFDERLTVVEANAALGALMGTDAAGLHGRDLAALVAAAAAPAAESLRRQLDAGGPGLVDAPLAGEHGATPPVAIRAWAVHSGTPGLAWAALFDPQLERRRADEVFLARVARRGVALELIRSIRSEADLLRAVAEAARGLTGADLAAVSLNGVGGAPFEVFVPAGMSDAEVAGISHHPTGRGVLSAMVVENRPLRVDDAGQHPAAAGLPRGHPPVVAFLGLPLVAGAQTIGHLMVANRVAGRPLDQADEAFLADFAPIAADAIAHVRTAAQARNAAVRLRQLVVANLDLIRQTRPESLPRAAVELARTVTDAAHAALLLVDPESGEVQTFLHVGLTPAAAARIGHPPVGRGVLHAAMAAGRPMRLTDLRHHPTHAGFPAHHPVMRSFLSVPVTASGRTRGLLFCTDKRVVADFTGEDEEAVTRIAAAVGAALDTRSGEGDELLRNLATASERLREEEARHWRFLGSLSHELRSATGGILMSAELLADPAFGNLAEEQVRTVSGRISTTARSLMQLIDNLLDLSRIQAGRLEVRMQPVDVRPIVAEVLAELGPVADDAELTLDGPPPSEPPARILADPVRVRQVLVNLVNNAIKFTPAPGHVVVEVQAGDQDLVVAVSDTGTGIDPSDLERLFEPFERARDAQAPGTGLGLAISRAIMELHGGRLEAESWPGVGSRFTAAFRVARLPYYTPEIDEAVAAEGPLVMGRGSILLVEDDEASRESTVTVLNAAGYRVRAVSTRAEALAAMAGAAPDVVLLDVQLPDGDGLEIVADLRLLAGERGARIVAFSADRIGGTEERAMLVCDAFVLKPLRPRELLRRVGELVGG